MSKAQKKLIRRRLIGSYASSILSISLVLLLVGLASMLLVNTKGVTNYFKEHLQMSVIFKQSATEHEVMDYKARIDKMEFIRATRLVTKEEGAEQLKAMLGEDFLKMFRTSPVPLSLDVTLKADYVQADSLKKVSAILAAPIIVDEVDSRQSLVESVSENMARITFWLGLLTVLLLFISLVLISNTVRLSVYSERFNIHTMRLVGATRGFIRRPFIWRACLQGLISAAIAVCALLAGLFFVRDSFPQLFHIFTLDLLVKVILIVTASGVLICAGSTFKIVNKLIVLNKDELYG